MRRAPALTFSRPAYVVALSSLSPMSSAVGPTITVPSTVGETRMPLPIFEGTWNIVAANVPSSSLSSIRYSPRRASMLYFVALTRLFSSSEWMPAALTTAFASNARPSAQAMRHGGAASGFVRDWTLAMPTTFASKENSTPFAAAFSAVRKVSS